MHGTSGETPVARGGTGGVHRPHTLEEVPAAFRVVVDRRVDKTGQVPWHGQRWTVPEGLLQTTTVQLHDDPHHPDVPTVWRQDNCWGPAVRSDRAVPGWGPAGRLGHLSPNHLVPPGLAAPDDWTPRQFYRRLAHALGCPAARFPEETEQPVRDTLWALATQPGRQPVLAVDEAHPLPPRLLQELRFLLNYHLDSTAPVALILCGHTELRHKLALRPLEAIRQRVTVAYHLPPLTAAETGSYVTHQLQGGVDRLIFTDTGPQTGWDWSHGIPRRFHLAPGLLNGGVRRPAHPHG